MYLCTNECAETRMHTHTHMTSSSSELGIEVACLLPSGQTDDQQALQFMSGNSGQTRQEAGARDE